MHLVSRLMLVWLVSLGLIPCVISIHSEPTWDTLRVTWGIITYSPGVFANVPQTEKEAQEEGYTRLTGECDDGKFAGVRYMKGQDVAAVLIYDVNGYIAGIQNGIPKKYVDSVKLTSFSYNNTPTYQLDEVAGEEVYFQTIYFIVPSKICNGGRSAQEYQDQGTGTDVYYQNSPDPLHSIKIPRYEKDAVGTPWVKGGCFKTMGVHYWYNMHEDMSCSDFVPFTPIYNRGKLTSFAFLNVGKYTFSSRFEYPSIAALKVFMPNPVPECISKEMEVAGGATTLHVYFTIKPENIMC